MKNIEFHDLMAAVLLLEKNIDGRKSVYRVK